MKMSNENRLGPIVIIEDDLDDQDLISEVLKELDFPNEVVFFKDGYKALEYLEISENKPFLILSDINMPKLSGLQLMEKVRNNEDLRLRCIPYLFFTTAADQKAVVDAYSKSVQGFFVKPNTLEGLAEMLKTIITYWKSCQSPNYIK